MRMFPRRPLALLCLLGPVPLPATPLDLPVPLGRSALAHLPTIQIGRPASFDPLAASQLSVSRATPFLDRLLTEREIGFRAVRRRTYQFDLAGGRAEFETLRLKANPSDGSRTDMGPSRKSWSWGARSEWALGADDSVYIGVATGSYHPAQRSAVLSNPHDATSLATVGVGWAHGGRWRVDLGWRQVGGTVHGAADRMVQLGNGAPLHEAGIRLSAAFLPGGVGDPHQTSLGFEARRSSVAADDLAQLNAGQRQDLQGSLVMRTHF